jgi:SsrA-binding protein
VAEKTIASNRRARHDYEILETVEAGLVLLGSEIKSIRAGRVSLQEAFAVVEADEAWLANAHIAPYENAGYAGHEARRRRKLLLHRRQIDDLGFKTQAKGLTLVPLRLYLKGGRAKLELALARGRKRHDKRHAIREREMKRDMERAAGRQRR